jgi:hypothetical protein
MKRAAWLASLVSCGFAQLAVADAGWFESGDIALRNDLLLLNDAEVIRLPVGQWPMPRAAVRHALGEAKDHLATNAAVKTALERVRARLAEAQARDRWSLDGSLVGGEPGLLRDFDTAGRDSGEASARATFSAGDRIEVGLNVTAVADPADGQEIRADGSHATVRWGNWLLSAHTLDRWWGPGHESSLILSNNARPMPSVMVERATAAPFESRFLSWLGPWRFSFGIGQMESDRADIDAPLFMAWRVVVMPFKDIELGFSRTAQFCGKQLVCDLDSFANMLAGNDNVGIDATPENEPGNQMAGFDIRWNSPIGSWPYAIYSQMIGEDESSYLPAKYLSQFGLEAWKPFADGGFAQLFLEYSATTASAHSGSGPYYNLSYNQGLFNVEGYRYRGRVIGHTVDRDAEFYALGGTYTSARGGLWSATARTGRLNRDDFGDLRNTVASVPTDYDGLELGWKGRWHGQQLSVDLGVEAVQPEGGTRDTSPFGFVSWRYEFKP